MTDEALLQFLGFNPTDLRDGAHKARVIEALAPKRAAYERMAELTIELQRFGRGVGPKPVGVLVDWDRGRGK